MPKNFLVPLSQVLSATAHVAAAGGIQDEHSLSSPLTTKPSVRTSSFISESGKGFEELKGADKRYSWGLLDELTNVNQKRNSLAGTNTKENPDKYSTLTKSKLSNAVSSNSERRGDDDDDARTITGTGGGQPIARLNAKAKLSTLTRWKSSRAPVSPNIGTLKIAVIGDTHIGKVANGGKRRKDRVGYLITLHSRRR